MTDISDRPWSGITRASYASAAEYCAACLIDENEHGYTHSKARCKLPVYEPQRLGGRTQSQRGARRSQPPGSQARRGGRAPCRETARGPAPARAVRRDRRSSATGTHGPRRRHPLCEVTSLRWRPGRLVVGRRRRRVLPALGCVDDGKELAPRADGLAVLLGHGLDRLTQMVQVVHDPGREQLAQRDGSEGRVNALPSEVLDGDEDVERLEVRRSRPRESTQQVSEAPPCELREAGLPVHRLEDAIGSVLQDHTRPVDPVAFLHVRHMPDHLVRRPGARPLGAVRPVVSEVRTAMRSARPASDEGPRWRARERTPRRFYPLGARRRSR